MKIIFLRVQSNNEKWSLLSSELYAKKIAHFMPFEFEILKSAKSSRDQAQQKAEAESQKILDFLKPDDFVILFDERGLRLTSMQFSKKFERWTNSGKKRLLFVIGGSFGVDDRVKARAQEQVQLSEFVLNHNVAETVALEQIYRALTILKNMPYHNA